MNYYNEIDPVAAAWLRQLIALGLIPAGDVDERSIKDVMPKDLEGFTQCHFFAGVAGWPLALERTGVPPDTPLWTGSCPCQSFSCAGKRKGFQDARDLWPEFNRLIRECRPQRVIGEQVASAIKFGWLDRLHSGLEAQDYAVGAVVLGAHSAGADHIRQRLFWVADAPRLQVLCRGRGDVGPQARGRSGADQCRRQGTPTLQTMVKVAPWKTPSSVDGEGGVMPYRPDLPKGLHYRLRDQSQLASWVTPAARDHKDSPGQHTSRSRPDQLPRQAHSLLSPWLTPSASDDAAGNPGASMQPMLGSQAKLATSGAARSRTSASTARRGVLNPAFSRWLMSFPAEWDVAALLAARSMPPRRRARPGKPQGVALVSVSRPAGIRPLSSQPTRTRRARRA